MLLTSFLSLGEFLSTLSLRRATCARCIWRMCGNISIHALLAESDTRQQRVVDRPQAFLSTLSLRRATLGGQEQQQITAISIHALLAESDACCPASSSTRQVFLSTLSLRRATGGCPCHTPPASYFYPRSPCGERPIGWAGAAADYSDFYPRSPCGERLGNLHAGAWHPVISIHALLAESDGAFAGSRRPPGGFLSTLSLRRATGSDKYKGQALEFLSTLSLRRATSGGRAG